jgi:hypothetical protein
MPNTYWMPMTVLGYAWLQLANSPGGYSPPSLAASVMVTVAGCIAYLAASAWVRSTVLSGRRPAAA